MTRICAVVLTKNEEEMIGGCLRTLRWADQLVVLDAQSEDRTVEIAKAYTPDVYVGSWEGFSAQRNAARQHLSGDWILFVDADERATPTLRDEVREAVRTALFNGFRVPTKNILLGRWHRYGGWFPEYHLRLFRRDAWRGCVGVLHEVYIVDEPIGVLRSPLIHLSHRSIESMVLKTAYYSRLEAAELAPKGRVGVAHFLRAIAREFVRRAVRRYGFLDGPEGWIEILYQSFSQFITQARAWELQRGEPLRITYQRIEEELSRAFDEGSSV